MKSNKDFRGKTGYSDAGELRKEVKLQPIRKSGKDKNRFYFGFEEDDDDLGVITTKRESVFDYFDDGEDD